MNFRVLGGASKAEANALVRGLRAARVVLALNHRRHAGLDGPVRCHVDDSGDLGFGVERDVIVLASQLEVVVRRVCRVVGDVEGVAADRVEDVGVVGTDGGPGGGALDGARGVANLLDVGCLGGSERRPGDEKVSVGEGEVAQVDGRVGGIQGRSESHERGADEGGELHLDGVW